MAWCISNGNTYPKRASPTPFVYDVALKHLGIPHDFGKRNATSVTDLEPLLYDTNFGDASLAQGFKVSILPLIQHLSVSSKVIGAVNTIIPIRCEWKEGSEDARPPVRFWRDRNHGGPVKGLYGENTDWIGMYRSVKKRLSPVNAVSSKTTGLVLGAGGMARAAVYAMIQMGVRNIFVHNRTTSRAIELADYFNSLGDETTVVGPTRQTPERPTRSPRHTKVHVIKEFGEEWPVGFSQPTIIISCLRASPGTGQPTPNVTLPPNWLRSPHGGVVVDTGYEPLISPLVAQMHQEAHRGWITVDGFHILPEQAAAQFEFFTGRRAPRLHMAAEILKQHPADTDPRTKELVKLRLEEVYIKLGLNS
ncbi:hypothetical protein NW759_001771 [Fusarium solani]|nr:hypothetical protein NW759_001771 [Fusarium solani]